MNYSFTTVLDPFCIGILERTFQRLAALTGSKFLPRLDVSTSLETDRRTVHQVRACRVDEEAQQHCVQPGRVWGGLRQTAVGSRLRLSTTSANGSQLQISTNHTRRRQFHLPQQVSTFCYLNASHNNDMQSMLLVRLRSCVCIRGNLKSLGRIINGF